MARAGAQNPARPFQTMPFYEYECDNCKFYTEVLQKVSDPPLLKCPSCGKNKLKKLISAPVFRLKGGGWYETDFKSDQEGKRNLATDKEPDVVVETKPAAKPADAKPGDSKPAESKPAESKASESKSADSGDSRKNASRSASKSKPASRPAAKSKRKAAPARRKRR